VPVDEQSPDRVVSKEAAIGPEARLSWLLSWLAGMIGAVAFLHSAGYFVTFMTGNTERAVLGWFDVAERQKVSGAGPQAALWLMACFLAGVNVASMAAKVTTPGISVYCATKYAVAALSRAVRGEIADTDVTITTLMPTAVHTELTAGVSLNLLPTRQPEQIVETIADSARRPGREVTVPWWLAPFGAIEEVTSPSTCGASAAAAVSPDGPPPTITTATC